MLVTGATGYIGSRLVPALLDADHEVVAAMRDPDKKSSFAWGDRVDTARFDLDDHDTFDTATAGVDAVVYLVHSMDEGDFVRKDAEAAERMAAAAEKNGVDRIVYVSGLIPDDGTELSDHLRSRLQVEEIFLASSVDATVLRAAIILGSGSTSFELVRRMTERLPVTPVPTWMNRKVQPIAVADVVRIVAASLRPEPTTGSFDIGGEEVLTYPELLGTYARVAGLRRPRIPVPFAPVSLVGKAVAATTRMPEGTVSSLVESLTHEMTVRRGNAATAEFADPNRPLIGLTESIERSITESSRSGTEADIDPQKAADTDPSWAGGVVSLQDGTIRHRPTGRISRLALGTKRN
ncbi:hypothetical protein BJI47_14190 [Rhodococcus sp. 1168]|nr:hypothetical protein BJI47_14190 [Rhodococcus sp. 1168]